MGKDRSRGDGVKYGGTQLCRDERRKRRVEKEGKKEEGISRLVWREVVRKADGEQNGGSGRLASQAVG